MILRFQTNVANQCSSSKTACYRYMQVACFMCLPGVSAGFVCFLEISDIKNDGGDL